MDVVAFHECCVTGYAFLQDLPRERLLALAEELPAGPSCQELQRIAARCRAPVLAGLVELDKASGKMYNTYAAFSKCHRHRHALYQ